MGQGAVSQHEKIRPGRENSTMNQKFPSGDLFIFGDPDDLSDRLEQPDSRRVIRIEEAYRRQLSGKEWQHDGLIKSLITLRDDQERRKVDTVIGRIRHRRIYRVRKTAVDEESVSFFDQIGVSGGMKRYFAGKDKAKLEILMPMPADRGVSVIGKVG